jgi:hypothetical protein
MDDNICLICHENIRLPANTPPCRTFCCGNDGDYHTECLTEYFDTVKCVKCPICRKEYRKPLVYFAGKVDGLHADDTRIVLTVCDIDDDESLLDPTRVLSMEHDTYICTGPVIIDEKHGACIGRTLHGLGPDTCRYFTVPKEDVLIRCMNQIKASNVILAKFDADTTCFGTMNEIGVAFNADKLILLDVSLVSEDTRKELWFAIQMSISSIKKQLEFARDIFKLIPHTGFSTLDDYIAFMSEYLYIFSWSGDRPPLGATDAEIRRWDDCTCDSEDRFNPDSHFFDTLEDPDDDTLPTKYSFV